MIVSMDTDQLDDIINRLLDAQLQLGESEIRGLCRVSREVFLSQPILLELQAPVKICGDIRGQYPDLLRLFEYGGFPPLVRYLFLGNYVDYGEQSIETICLLLAYKIRYPDNFFLLRGNFESAAVNLYGFYDECKKKFNVSLWKVFNDCFNCMPIVAMIDGKVLCVHGGLSPDLKHLDQIRNICRPTDVPDQGLLCDLLWADPDPYVKGWRENDAGVSYKFGAAEVKKFLSKHDINLICRGNQITENGYAFFADGQMATVFSAPNFQGKYSNAGAMMSIDEALKCSFQILKPDEKAMKLFHSKALRSGCIDEALKRSFQILKPDEKAIELDLHSKSFRSGSRSPLQSGWRMEATAAALARRENVKVASATLNVPRSVTRRVHNSAPQSIRRRGENVKRLTLFSGEGYVNSASASQPTRRQRKDVKRETSPLRKRDFNSASPPLRRRREDVKRETSPHGKGDSNSASQLIRQHREGVKCGTSPPRKGDCSSISQSLRWRREDAKQETSPPRKGDCNIASQPIRQRREDTKQETSPPRKGDCNIASQPIRQQRENAKQETSPPRKGDCNIASQPIRQQREDAKQETAPPYKGDCNIASQPIRQQREDAKRDTSPHCKSELSTAFPSISLQRVDAKRETSPPRRGELILAKDCEDVKQRTSPPKVKSRPVVRQASTKVGSSLEITATRPVTPVRFERGFTSPLKGVFRWVTPTRVRRTSSPESVPTPATPTPTHRAVSPFSMMGFLRSKSPSRVPPQTPFRKEQKQ
ncbi:hypothetical protein Sjap_021013 [Stephania japonica]|uniref:protein-serine/threonine phosphatase n=1 Tax=Stephania japonica TaxID=461633 RepID=A0AAP0F2Q4_9MAGN